jgi:glycosyltransferase involved in cell wall biosynthesis
MSTPLGWTISAKAGASRCAKVTTRMSLDSTTDPAAPLVSVLLACRDAEPHLPAALAGIDAQTYRPLELLAVNDGSGDATGEILRAYAASRPWVRVLAAPGVGPAAARAVAFGASRGALLAIHDADDVSRTDRFAIQAAFLASHPDIGVLGTAADVIDDRGERIARYPIPLGAPAIHRTLHRAPPFVHGSVMMRREAYEAAGGFRAGFRAAEDFDLWLRIPPRFGLWNLAEPLYQWRSHDANSFHRHRGSHLEYLALARAFADERRRTGGDSAPALLAAGSPETFRHRYSGAPRLARYRAEAFIREGRTGDGRAALREAWRSLDPAILPGALAWWALSWGVDLTPRARRRRAEGRTERGTAA